MKIKIVPKFCADSQEFKDPFNVIITIGRQRFRLTSEGKRGLVLQSPTGRLALYPEVSNSVKIRSEGF